MRQTVTGGYLQRPPASIAKESKGKPSKIRAKRQPQVPIHGQAEIQAGWRRFSLRWRKLIAELLYRRRRGWWRCASRQRSDQCLLDEHSEARRRRVVPVRNERRPRGGMEIPGGVRPLVIFNRLQHMQEPVVRRNFSAGAGVAAEFAHDHRQFGGGQILRKNCAGAKCLR